MDILNARSEGDKNKDDNLNYNGLKAMLLNDS